MSVVTLLSGGLDSAVLASMISQEGKRQFPLFLNYGQLSAEKEWQASRQVAEQLDIGPVKQIDISGYGKSISSGLTDSSRDIYEDAFLPCRNLVFVTFAAAYAYQVDASSIALGLLREDSSLFPDQTEAFITTAEKTIEMTLNRPIRILAPLMVFSKKDIVNLAANMGIQNTYSCHAGTTPPCGSCVACREYQ